MLLASVRSISFPSKIAIPNSESENQEKEESEKMRRQQ